jgi:hypothetical protein
VYGVVVLGGEVVGGRVLLSRVGFSVEEFSGVCVVWCVVGKSEVLRCAAL